jgi:hypothetical protein
MYGHLVRQDPIVEYVQIGIFWSGFQQNSNSFENKEKRVSAIFDLDNKVARDGLQRFPFTVISRF